MPEMFSLRSLFQLSKRINEGPSLVEKDWRQVFYDAFALSASQREALEGLESEESGAHHSKVQETFRKAADAVRKGGRMKLRVSKDLDLGVRVLRLEVRKSAGALADEEMEPDEGSAILCCCADCSHWHRCGKRPNPCLSR